MPVLITLLQPIASVIERTSSPPEEDVDYLEIEEHRAVLKAIRAGQPENARQAMRAHFAFIDDSRYAEILQKPLAKVEAPRATPVEDTGAA